MDWSRRKWLSLLGRPSIGHALPVNEMCLRLDLGESRGWSSCIHRFFVHLVERVILGSHRRRRAIPTGARCERGLVV